jgi:hypothetical protein
LPDNHKDLDFQDGQPFYTPNEFSFIALKAHRDIPKLPRGVPVNLGMAMKTVYTALMAQPFL